MSNFRVLLLPSQTVDNKCLDFENQDNKTTNRQHGFCVSLGEV